LIAALVLALGIAVAGYFIGDTLYKTKLLSNTVTVKGLAEQSATADLAIWNLVFSVTGDDLQEVQQRATVHQGIITKFFSDSGFESQEVIVGGLDVRDMMADSYNQANMRVGGRYTITGNVGLRTSKVAEVDKLSSKTGDLITQGVVLASGNLPMFKFTKLNEVKPAMLAKSTASAREAAQQFAKDSQTTVKGIANAQQGIFSIEPIEGYEYKGDASVEKKIRVVTTVTFYLGE
jgi:hypothetical protein